MLADKRNSFIWILLYLFWFEGKAGVTHYFGNNLSSSYFHLWPFTADLCCLIYLQKQGKNTFFKKLLNSKFKNKIQSSKDTE